ncbi:MAG: hypothetical protein EBX52_02050 [Proteobacteria bacterium]|nr:hypothetical protein [Pseudomonadota bacterium]
MPTLFLAMISVVTPALAQDGNPVPFWTELHAVVKRTGGQLAKIRAEDRFVFLSRRKNPHSDLIMGTLIRQLPERSSIRRGFVIFSGWCSTSKIQ